MTGPDHARARSRPPRRCSARRVTATADGPGCRWARACTPGTAFVGIVGSKDASDFTALGDPVNIAAHLASQAAAGEILVTRRDRRGGGMTARGPRAPARLPQGSPARRAGPAVGGPPTRAGRLTGRASRACARCANALAGSCDERDPAREDPPGRVAARPALVPFVRPHGGLTIGRERRQRPVLRSDRHGRAPADVPRAGRDRVSCSMLVLTGSLARVDRRRAYLVDRRRASRAVVLVERRSRCSPT